MTDTIDKDHADAIRLVAGSRRELTHYAAWDARGRYVVTAFCGTSIRRRDHASDPTCPRCAALLAERETYEP